MEGQINPENWKDIFSDTLYIITDPNGVTAAPLVAEKGKPVATEAVVEAPKTAIPVTPAAPASPAIPKTPAIPSIPAAPSAAVKEQAVPKAAEPVVLKPSGKYSNGILILMHASYTNTPAQLEMLGKIVKAVQLDYADCGVLQTTHPVSLKDIETLKPRIILSFGLPADAFTPRLPKDLYAIQKHNATTILLADSLAKLETTVALKSSLWNAMKEMFGIK
ncbi:MAG: hypothetical protein ACTHJT_15785 [Cytophaga sp.]|uniref:hypothetical protein n=1 Tax=Cytophaga sp. TaxID=29535 RepID=UPI003F7F8FDD